MEYEVKQADRRERKKEQTRKAIIKTALELFNKYGFELTSMEQIAEATDIAKATLYKYFPNKDAIVNAYMHDTVRDNENRLRLIISEHTDTRSRLLSLFTQLHLWNEENRDIVRAHTAVRLRDIITPRGEGYNREGGLHMVLTRIISAGQEAGEIRSDLPAPALALYLRVMYLVPFAEWLNETGGTGHERMLEEMVDLFLDGAKKGRF